ncbi:hypothetical protein UA08_07173 [Talaromyces atroroseus]|uniref:Uncharacterized protein n=1 Tax=Talaromyces atroroseus TaxID=1441469 RepID=A0A225AT92_TALAT|nr:hypothetical protein UA08_07173 [Talaromyces atroroseus]OKL57635.1 hypothetical protein UA08_07173 [Talaromyces atroroseus]
MASRAAAFLALLPFTFACGPSYIPPAPKGLTTTPSSKIQGASISFKQTTICAESGAESYSGYVHLPPRADDAVPHPNNLYFYYAKSTKQTPAPLTLYIGGGPGASSISSMVIGVGACSVNPDSNSTSPNPWSWTRESNMLFVDQPTFTGYSYDVLTNATVDYSTSTITPSDFSNGLPEVNNTFAVGVFGSQNLNGTVNSTTTGAEELWDFMQVWLNEFPEYDSDEDKHKINVWTESFGGRYGPTYTAYFEAQNDKIKADQAMGRVLSPSPIRVDSLNIHNGCSDLYTQASFYPEIAYNNTYSLQVIDQQQYESAKTNLTKPDGCFDLAAQCRRLAQELDPYNLGNNVEVNTACSAADTYCYALYDMAQIPTSTVPPTYSDGFFNTAWVQEALGVPVNFTSNSNAVYSAFESTGNGLISRSTSMEDFAFIMERGVKVNLIHGDRDYLCNWMGGENVSLSINHENSAAFSSSGYEGVVTNNTYIGGVVRQQGHLSFTRVFEAGHEVPAYQPETMFKIFSRIMNSKDIATGKVPLDEVRDYSTSGPSSTLEIKDLLPVPPSIVCYTIDMSSTCTEEQTAALLNGTAIVEDYVVVWPSS